MQSVHADADGLGPAVSPPVQFWLTHQNEVFITIALNCCHGTWDQNPKKSEQVKAKV